jgi:mRNA interferase RelE/StbE
VTQYSLRLSRQAAKTLRTLRGLALARIQGALELLRVTPFPPAAKKLRNRSGYRVRVGDYRMLYEVDEGTVVILVVMIEHRETSIAD